MAERACRWALDARVWRLAIGLGTVACGSTHEPASVATPPAREELPDLRINEVVSNNEGVWIDEAGETDDYVELYNASERAIALAGYRLGDNSGWHLLPAEDLAPGQVKLLWADGSPEQGPDHLPFKISASGEGLTLARLDGREVDRVTVPALDDHHAYARMPDGTGSFRDCGWATPTRLNGNGCGPPAPAPSTDDVPYASFRWPAMWPPSPPSLVLRQAALHPARFVELWNRADRPVSAGDYALQIAARVDGQPWPAVPTGHELVMPAVTIAPGETTRVEVDDPALATLTASEGALTLIRKADLAAVDRLEFSAWPSEAVLARTGSAMGPAQYCLNAMSPVPASTCVPVLTRDIGDHVHSLATPGDFAALAAGRRDLGVDSVEFVIDLAADHAVTFLNSANWDLHFTYVREALQGLPHLNRCDPAEHEAYNRGWYAFSKQEYFDVASRHYLLGTLVRHAGSGLSTVEFTPGDAISADQMKQAFFTVMAKVPDPANWYIRPQTPDQVDRARTIEGQVPLVSAQAPFRGVTFQPLTAAAAFGTLRFIAADELREAAIGPRDIVVTDQVPGDIPLVGGLITESFQTPLAHVNVLSRGRGTPNMALPGARSHPRVQPFFGKLVRLEVTGSDFTLGEAAPEEALAFWSSRRPTGPVLVPRLDTSVRGVQALSERGIADIASIGGKASQLAELGKIAYCEGPVAIPPLAFAIPVVHSMEHLEASGARALLTVLQGDPAFLADPAVRAGGLARVRALIEAHPVDPGLLAEVNASIETRWSNRPLRFRSSGNAEDLSSFNGAGLYTSVGLDAGEAPRKVEWAIRQVWASLWNMRAYDERAYDNLDQSAVAMGVLVHEGFHAERANGVAISRDALHPTRGDRYYINAQVGEALVTNPAPGIDSDEFTYSMVDYQKRETFKNSSFSRAQPVLSDEEAELLSCDLMSIHKHFRPLLDPQAANPWFAMDIEWKLVGPERTLVIKQARPYSFGRDAPTGWCDF